LISQISADAAFVVVSYKPHLSSRKQIILSFKDFSLSEPIIKAIEIRGYINPTPIQQQAIPIILAKTDLLGVAQTGTGKTAAFAIPILQLLHASKNTRPAGKTVKALILTPTRELAIQIDESFRAYGKFSGLTHSVIFGGVSQRPQTASLQSGVDIVVATPGRLLDLVQQRHINLKDIEIFVLDEADRMLDMGFIHDVKKIFSLLPANKQTLFFSATMPSEIQQLANRMLHNAARVTVTPVSSTAEKVEQSVFFVEKTDKRALLLHVLKQEEIVSALVFTRTKHGADKVAGDLRKAGIEAEAIHGNKSQSHRQRVLTNFKSGHLQVLVATDIAARGIDVSELSHVINYEIPNIPETYVHRIGRTGRAGASGKALSFCDREEKIFLRDIQKLIKIEIPLVKDHPFPVTFMPSSTPATSSLLAKKRPGMRGRKTWSQVM
jgi:ATP-dependent RNA helicase RhlE